MVGYVATAEIDIDGSPRQVWAALTDPEQIKAYMFGTEVRTDWRPGSPIVWQGVYEGKAYEDHGEILEVVPQQRLKVTHFSPLTGQPDVPENYHTLSYELKSRGTGTNLVLTQDNNASEAEAEHSRGMWTTMLDGIKAAVEAGRSDTR